MAIMRKIKLPPAVVICLPSSDDLHYFTEEVQTISKIFLDVYGSVCMVWDRLLGENNGDCPLFFESATYDSKHLGWDQLWQIWRTFHDWSKDGDDEDYWLTAPCALDCNFSTVLAFGFFSDRSTLLPHLRTACRSIIQQ